MELKMSQTVLIAIWITIGILISMTGNVAGTILCSSIIIGLFIDKSGYKKVG